MIQFSSLSKPPFYDQYFTPTGRRMLAAVPAVHSNLNRTSLFSISKYGKITGKMVHSNHFFKARSRSQPSPMGGIADKYPKGAKYSKSSKHSEAYPVDPKGKPDLNGYLTSTIVSAPLVGVEFESNCSRTTVNQAKILFQSYEVPPPNPTTSIKIDLQNILIGFGGSRSSPKGGGGGRGRVRVELLAHHRK